MGNTLLPDLDAEALAVRPLERAETIPSSWYVDPRFHRFEREELFTRTWQLVGHETQLAGPGAYLSTAVAGNPVVLVRGNPVQHDRCLIHFDYYYDDVGSEAAERTIAADVAFSDRVQQEDVETCEHVQRGLASRAYDRGRFSVEMERGVYHFQCLLKEAYGRAVSDVRDNQSCETIGPTDGRHRLTER